MQSIHTPPPQSPSLTVHDFIDPSSYGFGAITSLSEGHHRVSRLDEVWFRQEIIQQLIAHTDLANLSGRRDGSILLALEAPQHGKDRVACIFSGRIVGYLAQKDVEYLRPTLQMLVSHRRHLEIPATLSAQNGTVTVFIHVPDVKNIFPANGFPAGKWLLLPGGNSVDMPARAGTITSVEIPDSGVQVPVVVHVKSVVEIRARSAMETFEVFLNGKSCGRVPPVKASSSLALIKVLESRGITPLMRAFAFASHKGQTIRVDSSSFEALNPHLVESILSA